MKPRFKYQTQNLSDKVEITSYVGLPLFNIVIMLLMLIFAGFVFAIFSFLAISQNAPGVALFLMVFLVLLFLMVYGIYHYGKKGRYGKIVIDKKSNTLVNFPGDLALKGEDIKKIFLTESTGLYATGMLAGSAYIPLNIPFKATSIKIETKNGERLLNFPLESFTKGEEILNVIKHSLKT